MSEELLLGFVLGAVFAVILHEFLDKWLFFPKNWFHLKEGCVQNPTLYGYQSGSGSLDTDNPPRGRGPTGKVKFTSGPTYAVNDEVAMVECRAIGRKNMEAIRRDIRRRVDDTTEAEFREESD